MSEWLLGPQFESQLRRANFPHTLSKAIPDRVITRPPSAELRPNQKDSDSLPEYDVLDPILSAFIEQDLSVMEIVAQGFDRDTVIRILDLVKRNEYKRRQAPPGIRISFQWCPIQPYTCCCKG